MTQGVCPSVTLPLWSRMIPMKHQIVHILFTTYACLLVAKGVTMVKDVVLVIE